MGRCFTRFVNRPPGGRGRIHLGGVGLVGVSVCHWAHGIDGRKSLGWVGVSLGWSIHPGVGEPSDGHMADGCLVNINLFLNEQSRK